MSVLFFLLKQFVKLGRGREGLDLLGFSPNLHPKLLSIILVVDRCPRFSGDASRISNAFTYLFILLILIHLRFKILFNAQEHPVVIITLSLRVPLYNTASVDLARLARLGEWITLSNYMLGNKGFFAHIAELTENSKSRLIVTGPVMPM